MFNFSNIASLLEGLFAGYQTWASMRPPASQDAQHAQVASAVIATAIGALQAHNNGVASAAVTPPVP